MKRKALQEAEQQEEARQAEIEELERMYSAEPSRGSGLGEQAKAIGKSVAKKAAKEIGKKVIKRYGWTAIAATSEIWGPIALVVGAIILLFLLVVIIVSIFAAGCNTTTGKIANFIIKIQSFGSTDICSSLVSIGLDAPAREPIAGEAPAELGLVAIIGVPVDVFLPPPRAMLRPCMLAKVQNIWSRSQDPLERVRWEQATGNLITKPMDWVVTSAYRPEDVGSYHARGEAADMALRNPRENYGSQDPRIDFLVFLAKDEGFVPLAGDTVDEYRRPLARTEGAHIHVEFNRNFAQNISYCDLS